MKTQTVRSGRPKSDEKRQAILEASGELFLRSGFKATSMDAVAAAAGVSKQTVYSHFDGKDGLLRACVDSKVGEYGLRAEDMPQDVPLPDALRRIGRQFVDLLNDKEVLGMHRLLISECVSQPTLAHAFHDAGPKPTIDALTSFLLANDIPSGRFGDGRDAAETFFVLLEHVHFMQLLLDLRPPMDAAERDAHVAQAVQRFLTLYA